MLRGFAEFFPLVDLNKEFSFFSLTGGLPIPIVRGTANGAAVARSEGLAPGDRPLILELLQESPGKNGSYVAPGEDSSERGSRHAFAGPSLGHC